MSEVHIGVLSGSQIYSDSVGVPHLDDKYNFSLDGPSSLSLSLTPGYGSVNWSLADSGGNVLQNGLASDVSPESAKFYGLGAGDYSLTVSSTGQNANYTLDIDPITGLQADSGYFTVKDSQVSVDFILDGGSYQGEVGLFNLEGMHLYKPGSEAFIKEATRRSLSSSHLGHIAINDSVDKARFDVDYPWEGSSNHGTYNGVKLLPMNPGDKFGIILVPNGTIEEVFQNPGIGEDKQPLFSLGDSNPDGAFHVGQLAAAGGNIFVMEDKQVSLGTDLDYNDIVFQVKGAKGEVVSLDGLVDPNKDIRDLADWEDIQKATNEAPGFLQEFPQINATGDSINIAGRVYDEEGAADLKRVQVWWRPEGSDDWGNPVEITSFTPDSQDDRWGSFDYSLPQDLSPGSYELKLAAYDALDAASNEVTQAFRVNAAPTNLQFAIAQNSYNPGDTIAISGGKVFDADGSADLEKVEFSFRKGDEPWQEIADVNSFAPDGGDNRWGNFDLNLTAPEAGSYEFRAVAYDRAGDASEIVTRNVAIVAEPPVPTPPEFSVPTPPEFSVPTPPEFSVPTPPESSVPTPPESSVPTPPESPTLPGPRLPGGGFNTAPQDVRFGVLPLYTDNEILRFRSAKAYDADGAGDLERVEFSRRKAGSSDWVRVGEVTEFVTDSNDKNLARFDVQYDLRGLTPGSYELRAIAYDKEGAASDEEIENFSVITDPGGNELSENVRLAMAEAANLDNYNPEALAQTREWAVWITPGELSANLAASLGAQDLGATGLIPNSYIWEFPEGLDPQDIANQLNSLPGVEYAYPQVPVDVRLLHQPTDDRFSEQWHLQPNSSFADAPPSITEAWDIVSPVTSGPVRGNNVVIGVIDDGLEYRHPDLQDRYRGDLSWDFTDDDNDPLPYTTTPFDADLSSPNVDRREGITFDLDVSLTGIVTDVAVDLDLFANLPADLPKPEDLEVFLISPSEGTAIDPRTWFAVRASRGWGASYGSYGSWWRFPGWNGLKFEEKVQLDVASDGTVTLDPDKFKDTYAGGTWKLQIQNPGLTPYTEQELDRISEELFENWSLTIETANPHGTAVAGVAAASENGEGVVGVAPEAQVAGLRLIASTDPVNNHLDPRGLEIADALSHAWPRPNQFNPNKDIDIFQNSWGPEYLRRQPLAVRALEAGMTEGRGGLGSIYVFSAGNERQFGGNANYNYLTNSRQTIPVGAITRNGESAFYSTPGAPVFVSAYSDDGRDDLDRSITTTTIELNNWYASDFGGTSAASPFVSGVAALMLDANPFLTARDFQHIFAETAKQINGEDEGWTTNGAGYEFNAQYGFGVVDPVAAVEAAADWTPVAEEVQVFSSLENVKSPIRDGQLLSSQIPIYDNITVEHAEVVFYADHDDWGDLTIKLISPDGTESLLAEALPDDPNLPQLYSGSNPWVFSSAAHWGESSLGDWTLEVLDENGNEVEGNLNSWKLKLYGTEAEVTVSAPQANASENGQDGQFTIARTGNTKHDLEVKYILGGTATNGDDYKALDPSAFVIPAGQESVTVDISAIDDSLVESDETVRLTLRPDREYALGGTRFADVTIRDNDDLAGNIVTNTKDSGRGSLRDAIEWANSNPGKDTIEFNIPTSDSGYNSSTGAFTIQPRSELPEITDSIVIDGTTQAGFSNAPIIELSGTNAGSSASGLTISAGDSTVRGFVINSFGEHGIFLNGSGSNVVEGNYIGTDVTGSQDLGNGLDGLQIDGIANNTIDSNLISGNDHGIYIKGSNATGNDIVGNYVGTDITGTRDLGNSREGIQIDNAPSNTVGGADSDSRNLISGNDERGIYINGTGAANNQVLGNYIGTDITGKVDLGNSRSGLYIYNAPNNIVGGSSSGSGNLISGNDTYGVLIRGATARSNRVLGNYVGTDVTGTQDLGNILEGVYIYDAPDNVIGGTDSGSRNLVSGNDERGIYINGTDATGNKILGNYVGTDITGTQDLGNTSHGVMVNSASNNTIGGTTSGAGNLVSGNDSRGIYIYGSSATGNEVLGNYVGTDLNGTKELGNASFGLQIHEGSNNILGGSTPGSGNLVSGNGQHGILVDGTDASGNQLLGNKVGTDLTGTQTLANQGDGITIKSPNNIVGGTTAEARNLISGNKYAGVRIDGSGNQILGNYIGTDITGSQDLGNGSVGFYILNGASNNTIGGTASGAGNTIAFHDNFATAKGVSVAYNAGSGNAILGNSVFGNVGLGIDLKEDGITPNDLGDTDIGANNLQNFPVLTTANNSGGSTSIEGTLNSTPNSSFRVELFSNPDADAEGQTFLGFQQVTSDSSGNASFAVNLPISVPVGSYITATATDLGSSNTSEFSQGIAVSNPKPTVQIVATDSQASEAGDPGRVTISRTGSTANSLTLGYTVGGTAVSGVDYNSLLGSITIPAGQSSTTVDITAIDDSTYEGTETVTLNLAQSANYQLGAQNNATVSISDNDSVPAGGKVTITVHRVKEIDDMDLNLFGGDKADFLSTLTINGQSWTSDRVSDDNDAYPNWQFSQDVTSSTVPISIQIDEEDRGWLSGIDRVDVNPYSGSKELNLTYNLLTGAISGSGVSGNRGEQIHVAGQGDDLRAEIWFSVDHTPAQSLSSPIPEAIPVSTSKPTVQIVATDSQASEAGDPGRVTISRTGSTANPLTLGYTVGGTAVSGFDYNSLANSITIPAGQSSTTVDITAIDDSTYEGTETVTLNLAQSANYQLGAQNNATVSITDNDSVGGKVTVTVHRVKQIDNMDFDWPWSSEDEADFLSTLTINGQSWTSNRVSDTDDAYPNWQFSQDVTSSTVPISIQIDERDGGLANRTDRVDVNPYSGKQELDLTYDLLTGEIAGSGVSGTRGQQIHVAGQGDDLRAEVWFSVDHTPAQSPSGPSPTVSISARPA